LEGGRVVSAAVNCGLALPPLSDLLDPGLNLLLIEISETALVLPEIELLRSHEGVQNLSRYQSKSLTLQLFNHCLEFLRDSIFF
jgi:hypothetical protein